MTASAPDRAERQQWGIAGGIALSAHLAVAAAVLAGVMPETPLVPEPVVLVELADDSPAVTSQQSGPAKAQPQPERVLPQPLVSPPIDAPQVRTPLPSQALIVPPPAPAQPIRVTQAATQPVAASAPAPATSGSGAAASSTPGGDAKARQQEVDYFSLVSAHLNRRKVYPAEAKRARQQGVVTVRFTVDRNGNVSGAAIKKSSGHAVLDSATLDLLARVAPLPRMPGSMQRDRVTLSLPIDYSLRTS